ncbi:hypothetical protein Bca52824_049336 [Brassica carinata]|uniref:Uncharacterized protein n=1 Tax=Brassica carinata TaxID=52824 RepID=A0A8X7RKN4_BRACI|nr:hypothetical protein Bca52824_049336 [Brassica carinata]
MFRLNNFCLHQLAITFPVRILARTRHLQLHAAVSAPRLSPRSRDRRDFFFFVAPRPLEPELRRRRFFLFVRAGSRSRVAFVQRGSSGIAIGVVASVSAWPCRLFAAIGIELHCLGASTRPSFFVISRHRLLHHGISGPSHLRVVAVLFLAVVSSLSCSQPQPSTESPVLQSQVKARGAEMVEFGGFSTSGP